MVETVPYNKDILLNIVISNLTPQIANPQEVEAVVHSGIEHFNNHLRNRFINHEAVNLKNNEM
jgi:hypothetical protein